MKKLLWLVPLLLTIPVLAVTPHFWETRTYDDFRKGKLTNLSITSEDELILAPRFDAVFNTEQTLIWSSVADSKGNIYLGTGHDGKVYRINPAGQGVMIADFDELDVLAVAVDRNDALYAATSPDGKVYKVGSDGMPQEFFNPGEKYIWSLVFDRQGRLMVATGDKGVIYRVTPDGQGTSFYDTDETHVISMAVDRDGNIIAGGDPKGYVYRIAPDGKAFVLYDSGMREIHSVAVAPSGTIYAAALNGRASFAPAAQPSTPAPGPAPGATSSITVTGVAESAQSGNVEVVVTSEAVSADTPRASSSRSVSSAEAQSVILEILPDGVVNTIWRSRDELVYGLLPRPDRLLFSTGTKGRIYSLDASRNTTLLVESTEEQTTTLFAAADRVYAASANIGKLFSLSDAASASGTYESVVRDTDAISSLGRIALKAQNPELVRILTRTGNTSAPDRTWSDWAALDANGMPVSPKARFVQWKAELRSERDRAGSLSSVTVPYLQQNFRPEVTSLEVLPSGVSLVKVQTFNSSGVPSGTGSEAANARSSARTGLPAPPRVPPRRVAQRGAQSFQWTATDKNQDFLTYDLHYRGDSERTWKLLKRDVEDAFYSIDSDTLPDGTYVVRVTAGDGSSNPASTALTGELESQPFTIDNTPPDVTMTQQAIEGNRARVAIDVVDLTSTLNQAEVSVDTGVWRPIFPNDGIVDSKSELFTWTSEPLASGEHVIAFRIYDENDNVAMGKLVVRIP
jgi:sugar lactone lactonase YvrE